jgi:hypothetical protein
MIRIIVAILLVGHGLVHLPGFVVPWRLATLEEMPYKTTLLAGNLDVGATGIRLVGLLWLLAAVGFVVAGGAVFTQHPWWVAVTLGVTLFSLALCILGWPEARFGLLVNLAILAYLFFGRR